MYETTCRQIISYETAELDTMYTERINRKLGKGETQEVTCPAPHPIWFGHSPLPGG